MTAATHDGDAGSCESTMNDRDAQTSKLEGPPANGGPSAKAEERDTSTAERDQALVLAAQSGDREAFRKLYDAYHRRAYAVALGVVKNPEDATDVVQEAFVKVHKHLASFQGSSSFYTWLYRIVMNLAIDHIRRSKKSRQVDYQDGVAREEDDATGLSPSLGTVNPRKALLQRELSDAIQAALDELPEYHRAVIVLREIEGLSYEEMSEALEVPKGTIMSRLFHARRKMQQSLSPYLGDHLKIED
jgi:RNA polymerase sigma-70 factor (ECF subfamily)